MVWTLEWVYPSDNDNSVKIFDNEINARKQACANIIKLINSRWDLSDSDYKSDAIIIGNFINQGTVEGYKNAIKYWNYHSKNTNAANSQYWYVQEHVIFDKSDDIDLSFLNIETVKVESVIQSGSGAICRKCNIKNEYATADDVNGTYVCRSCSIFGSMFG